MERYGASGDFERMEAASVSINAFIWIQCPLRWGIKDAPGPFGLANPEDQFNDPRYIPKKKRGGGAGKNSSGSESSSSVSLSAKDRVYISKISPGPVRHLAAALYIFSCCLDDKQRPWWTRRIEMMMPPAPDSSSSAASPGSGTSPGSGKSEHSGTLQQLFYGTELIF